MSGSTTNLHRTYGQESNTPIFGENGERESKHEPSLFHKTLGRFWLEVEDESQAREDDRGADCAI